ncbi:hypothetical protein O988_06288 [Pseudogymnoascus sp. VKM F-3808]|nr:hypothetical protein O988_06288 [Pseudogymnoascus sp. VKM F-3808]
MRYTTILCLFFAGISLAAPVGSELSASIEVQPDNTHATKEENQAGVTPDNVHATREANHAGVSTDNMHATREENHAGRRGRL